MRSDDVANQAVQRRFAPIGFVGRAGGHGQVEFREHGGGVEAEVSTCSFDGPLAATAVVDAEPFEDANGAEGLRRDLGDGQAG